MQRRAKSATGFLGIECGGTRSVALCVDDRGRLLQRIEAGPANWRLIGAGGLRKLLRTLARPLPTPRAVAIGMAGVRGEEDRRQVRQIAQSVWKTAIIHSSHDLETALWAVGGAPDAMPRIVVLSGTGSCCYGRSPAGEAAKIGGWGHLIGDKGSGYEIGLRALKACVYYLDRDQRWTSLGQRILRALQLNEPEQLIGWVQSVSKDQVAGLAIEVFAAAAERDSIARDILKGAAASLAKDAVSCAHRLSGSKPGPAEFVFAGSVLQRQPAFAAKVAREIKARCPGARFKKLNRETAWGAVELAMWSADEVPKSPGLSTNSTSGFSSKAEPSTTEERHPKSMNLDRMTIRYSTQLFLQEDAMLPSAIMKERPAIERLIRRVVRAFKNGGRLFYVGAGTSGRLGVLDASECPPTFRTPPGMVQGIIAGGQAAIWSAVEGAEDDAAAGGRAMEFRGVTSRDLVLGIAASGRTPFVRGALSEAEKRGAATALLHFNSKLEFPRGKKPDIVICPPIGPELLTGSTRLKAGTATKLILNMITTIAMVRLGKVVGNLMVDLNPSNIKLRDRATRIVTMLTGASETASRAALERAGWNVKQAVSKLSPSKRTKPRR